MLDIKDADDFSIARKVLLFKNKSLIDVPHNEPVVISLPMLGYFQSFWSYSEFYLALRDRIIAELLKNYNCVILSRSHGLTLSHEQAIKNLQLNKLPSFPEDSILAPDYAISMHVKTNKIKGVNLAYGYNTQGQYVFLINDLREDGEADYQKISFTSDELCSGIEGDYVAKIVSALNLGPKKIQRNSKRGYFPGNLGRDANNSFRKT